MGAAALTLPNPALWQMKNFRPGFRGVPEVMDQAGSPQKQRKTGSSSGCTQREAHPSLLVKLEEESMEIVGIWILKRILGGRMMGGSLVGDGMSARKKERRGRAGEGERTDTWGLVWGPSVERFGGWENRA